MSGIAGCGNRVVVSIQDAKVLQKLSAAFFPGIALSEAAAFFR
jgi:hypothetical protein